MRISFIEPHLGTYGGIRRVVELSNRLTARGHDVTIYHSDGSPCGWMKCIAGVESRGRVLERSHDVVIYNDPNPTDYMLARRALAALKVFYVLELYEKELLDRSIWRLYLTLNRRMLFLKKSLCSPCLKMTNATWLYHWLRDRMSIESKLLLGGVNTEMFYPAPGERDAGVIRVLCSGDPRERKGTGAIIEAVRIAREREPRLVLDTYHGAGIPQEGMARKYSSADIFVEGSWQAGWNNPAAEAMACGVPVVCTDIGGVKDFAFDGETALLVPPKDPRAMASAILRLAGDERLRESLAARALKHIRTFDWDESAERLEGILLDELG